MRLAGKSAVAGERMSFSRRIGELAVDVEPGALVGVGDQDIAHDDPLTGLELDLQRHAELLRESMAQRQSGATPLNSRDQPGDPNKRQ